MLFFLQLWWRYRAKKSVSLYAPFRTKHKVGLADIDLNLHLNNARYLKYMDRSRFEHSVASGLFQKLWRSKTNVVISSTEITYIKELPTWQSFEIETRILGWDEKYLYMEQRFYANDALCTHALLRMACVQNGRSIAMPKVAKQLNITSNSQTQLPKPIIQWQSLLASKKQLSQPSGAEHE